MKFHFQKKTNQGTFIHSIVDTEYIYEVNHLKETNEEGKVIKEALLLNLALQPIETYQDFPNVNAKGLVNGWNSKKITRPPIIEMWDKEDIDRFLETWN